MYNETDTRKVDACKDGSGCPSFELKASATTVETITENVGGPFSNFRGFSLLLQTIDSGPVVDPRVAFSLLSFTGRGTPDPKNEDVDCKLTFKNTDTVSHAITLESDFTYTYSDDAGKVATGYGNVQAGGDQSGFPTAIPARGSEIFEFTMPNPFDSTLENAGNYHLLTLTVNDIVVNMEDPGDDPSIVPPQLLKKTFATNVCSTTL